MDKTDIIIICVFYALLVFMVGFMFGYAECVNSVESELKHYLNSLLIP